MLTGLLRRTRCGAFVVVATTFGLFTPAVLAQPFRITVVDAQTKRGVPLVELRTVNEIVFITDSAGVAAVDDPGLMNQDVYFWIKSHGYTYPADGFGYAGKALRLTPAGKATLEVNRVNIAERLYRVTGEGIYGDSVKLGDTPPIAQGVLNGEVFGQDSVQRIIYRGRIHWFWGDTSRARYPLGNFHGSGAVSDLPGQGGLDPSVGANLRYFVDPEGFSKRMCPMGDKPGPVWFDGLFTVADSSGRERLYCHYVRVKTLGELYEQGFALYNDEKDIFEPIVQFPLDAPLHSRSHPIRHVEDGVEYFYFPSPYAMVRCRAEVEPLLDPAQYEAFTCLKPGTRYEKEKSQLDRDAAGRLVYAWKKNTGLVEAQQQNELIQAGLMTEEEAFIQTRDVETGKRVLGHSGSINWNEHRNCWVMILQEVWGSSMLGEVWYLESPTLVGPWESARKVVTHDDYSFYNVVHHPFFDQEGGRFIYFEGTYTRMFSGAPVGTPRYDYNQVMYRLDLADERLWASE